MWSLLGILTSLATAIFLLFANWGYTPAEVEVIADQSYASVTTPDLKKSQNQKNNLDIYIADHSPLSSEERATDNQTQKNLAPVFLFIHGGGLMIGDKKDIALLGHKFASLGYTTVLVNHRLSPGASHPEHINDIAAAFAWVNQNIEQYGGDPQRIFVAGHSSGGYLAMLLASDPRYLLPFSLTPQDIRGVIPVSGFFFIDRLAPERPKSVWGENPDKWLAASPPSYTHKDTPPTLLLYAENDNDARKLESIDLAEQLSALEHPDILIHEIANRNHATIGMYMMTREDDTSDKILAFMRRLSEN